MLHFTWLAALLLSAAVSSSAAEQTLPILVTRSGTYTNVTVTTKNKDYVFILHAAGMANIRIQDLSEEAQEELGYVQRPEKKNIAGAQEVFAKELLPAMESKLKPIEAAVDEQFNLKLSEVKLSPAALWIAAGVLLLFHLFYSYCCHLITIKSKRAPTILAWLPVLQSIPLLRAAEMSAWWFLLLWFPLVPIVWAFKIVKARGMNVFVAIALLLPVTNVFAFLYLAFAKEAPPKDAPRYQSMSLQTA